MICINVIVDNPQLRACWFKRFGPQFRHVGPGKYFVENFPNQDHSPHCDSPIYEVEVMITQGLGHWENDPTFNLTPAWPFYGWGYGEIEKYIQEKLSRGEGVYNPRFVKKDQAAGSGLK